MLHFWIEWKRWIKNFNFLTKSHSYSVKHHIEFLWSVFFFVNKNNECFLPKKWDDILWGSWLYLGLKKLHFHGVYCRRILDNIDSVFKSSNLLVVEWMNMSKVPKTDQQEQKFANVIAASNNYWYFLPISF